MYMSVGRNVFRTMKKISVGALVLVVVAIGLFTLFNGKGKEVRGQRFPKESFSVRQYTLPNDSVVFLMVDDAFKDYQFREDYPWFLWVKISGKDTVGGSIENTDLDLGEQLSESQLKKVCTAHYIARFDYNHWRGVYYYVDDSSRASEALQALSTNANLTFNIEFNIEPDKDWKKVDHILNVD
jgi:hypothetical protein